MTNQQIDGSGVTDPLLPYTCPELITIGAAGADGKFATVATEMTYTSGGSYAFAFGTS